MSGKTVLKIAAVASVAALVMIALVNRTPTLQRIVNKPVTK